MQLENSGNVEMNIDDVKEKKKKCIVTINGKKHKNHYCTNPLGIYYGEYMFAMTKCGFDEFEGF